MGGFFRKEIKTVADLKGLKFRIAGLAGQMLARLGVVPQQLPAGEICSALEKGAIDAAEWTVPYDDEKLGLGKVARFYYTPGFWEGGASLHALVNNKAWEALPADFKAAFESASYEANAHMTARYDTLNPSAMRRLLASGVQLRAFPKPVRASTSSCRRSAAEPCRAAGPSVGPRAPGDAGPADRGADRPFHAAPRMLDAALPLRSTHRPL
jgi:TRAP-type mannitol/chloroaromatic compound transport system substrate-binding protein